MYENQSPKPEGRRAWPEPGHPNPRSVAILRRSGMPQLTPSAPRSTNARTTAQILKALVILAASVGSAAAGTLHGFVLTGTPTATNGATWTYRDTVAGVIYDLQGILLRPTGTGKLPAVVISHGHDNNVNTYSINIARTMRAWGLVCIATNYTHAAGVPTGSPGDSTEPGASLPNILRARKCIEILDSLGYVDTTRIAAHGNSMGAFVTAAVVGTYPHLFRAASQSAGGVNDYKLAWTKSPQASGITVPYQYHHGDADTTVPIQDDYRLDSILAAQGTVHQFYVYPGYNHVMMGLDTTMLGRVHTWYITYGLLPAAGTTDAPAPPPAAYALEQNYPNPFNPSTTIAYRVPQTAHVRLRVYDALGRNVATLVDAVVPPGIHSATLDGAGLASGVYYYRIETGTFVAAKRTVLVK